MSKSTHDSAYKHQLNKPFITLPLKITAPFQRFVMIVWMIGTDLISLMTAGWLSIQIRTLLKGTSMQPESYFALVEIWIFFIFAYSISGLYPGVGLTQIEELQRMTRATSTAVIILSVILFLTQSGLVYSRLIYALFWAFSLIILPVNRLLAKKLGSILGLWGENVALIGFGPQGKKIYDYLRQNPFYGYRLVLIVNYKDCLGTEIEEKTDLPQISAALLVEDRMYLSRNGIYSAILAPTEIPKVLRESLVDEQQFGLKRLILISSLNWIGGSAVVPHDMGGLLGLEVERNLLNAPQRLVKIMLDLFLMIFGCLFGLPVLLLCAGLIRLDSPGPVFYRQERVGRRGRKFHIWKFRTMIQNADDILAKYLAENPSLSGEWEATHKLKNDPRITKIGRLLRKTSLDELPQLFNVLAGEMSLVGPRPIVNDEIKFYGESFRLYTQVLPGLTGLWQISGRSNTSYANRVSLDEYYIRHWSIFMDIYVLIRTVWIVIRRSGAY